jgi:hypothetical protein
MSFMISGATSWIVAMRSKIKAAERRMIDSHLANELLRGIGSLISSRVALKIQPVSKEGQGSLVDSVQGYRAISPRVLPNAASSYVASR